MEEILSIRLAGAEATASQMPLQMDTAARLFDSGKSFYMCACRQDDYAPNYFCQLNKLAGCDSRLQCDTRLYRSGVSLEGINYRWWISDAILLKRRQGREQKRWSVIRTVPSQMYYTPQWFKRMERWLGDSSLQPLVNLVQHHETSYREIQQFIEKPPGQLRIFEIYPPEAIA